MVTSAVEPATGVPVLDSSHFWSAGLMRRCATAAVEKLLLTRASKGSKIGTTALREAGERRVLRAPVCQDPGPLSWEAFRTHVTPCLVPPSIASAVTTPDAKVITAIATIAHRMPKTSARMPAQSAPIA